MRMVFANVNGMSVPIMNGAHQKETEGRLWLRETGTSLKSRGCSRDWPHRAHRSCLKPAKHVIPVGPAFTASVTYRRKQRRYGPLYL